MSGTRRAAWRPTAVAMLLALQLVVVPTSSRAQDAVDAAEPAAAPTDVIPSPPDAPDVVQPAEPLATDAPAPSGPTPAQPAAARPSFAPYALWGTSVVSLALGVGFGVMALSAKKDFNDAPTYKRADKVHNLGIAADTGLGLGLLLAITGTVFYFLGHESDGTKHGQAADARTRAHTSKTVLSTLRLAPFVGPRAQGGTLALRF